MHVHGPASGRGGRALGLALGLVLAFAVVEVVGGLLADSLALLADAAHMLGDAGSLGLAAFAVWIGRRPPTAQRTFGYRVAGCDDSPEYRSRSATPGGNTSTALPRRTVTLARPV